MHVFLTLVVLLIGSAIAYVLKKRRAWPQFPTSRTHFFFGHALEINSATILTSLQRWAKECGPTFGFQIGPIKKGIVTQDYKLMEIILNSNKLLTKSENYKFLKPWLGDGLLLSKGKYWREHRKIITPAFHFEILKDFLNVFESVGQILIEKLEKCANPTDVDLYPYITLCTLDIICETAMGTKVNAQINENSEYVQAVKSICQIVIRRALSAFKLYDVTFQFTDDYKLLKKNLNTLHSYSRSVIRTNIEEKKRIDDGEMQEQMAKKRMAFLNLLVKYSNNQQLLSLEEIREEVDTFMFEGHDTTGTAITFALFSIASHPKVQEKILIEQKELFGDEKRPNVTYNDLQNMKYLEMVIKETLRLYPPVPFVARILDEEIKYDDKIIPKGTNVSLFIYGIHRDPQYFENPEEFNPDRFLTIDGSLPFAYVPFSAGPRNCIGQKFAMLEMKSTISKVIRNFELFPTNPKHEMKVVSEIVLKSANGARVAIKKRI